MNNGNLYHATAKFFTNFLLLYPQFANIFIPPKQSPAVASTSGAIFIKKAGIFEENSKQFHKLYNWSPIEI